MNYTDRPFVRFTSLALAVGMFFQISAEAAIPFGKTTALPRGHTYFSFMKNTVKPALDQYALRGFYLSKDPATAISTALANSDTKVYKRATGKIGEQGLVALLTALNQPKPNTNGARPSYTHASLPMAIRSTLSTLKLQGDMYDLSTFLTLASGAGVAVVLDQNNIFYNVGYGAGKEPRAVQTGRSFGAGPAHKANDASDIFYLNELESFLKTEKDATQFYRVLMQIVTNSDSSLLHTLSPAAQTILSDFAAVYTAESDRHLMVGLNPKMAVWEWDLLATTLVSDFCVELGVVVKNGQLVKAPLKDWWTKNEETGRSGIGKTARDRKILTQKISDYERKVNPKLVQAIDAIIGTSGNADIFQSIAIFLSNPKTPDSLGPKAKALTEAFVKFLVQAKRDASAISMQ